MDTLTLTAGDASVSVTLPPPAADLIDPDDAESRKRQDTNFKFEVVSPDGTHFSAEARAKKSRSDTNFKFELGGTPAGPGSESDMASLAAFDPKEGAGGSAPHDEAFAATGKKRQDTSFDFEITMRDDPADDSAEAFAGKQRSDTSFKFEVVTSKGTTGSTELLAGRTRKDTSFKFEVVASDPDSVPTEALVASKRKSANLDFERVATPTDGGLTITEMRESLGGSSLVSETPDEAKKPRHDTSFSVVVVTPDGVLASVVVRSSESAGTYE